MKPNEVKVIRTVRLDEGMMMMQINHVTWRSTDPMTPRNVKSKLRAYWLWLKHNKPGPDMPAAQTRVFAKLGIMVKIEFAIPNELIPQTSGQLMENIQEEFTF